MKSRQVTKGGSLPRRDAKALFANAVHVLRKRVGSPGKGKIAGSATTTQNHANVGRAQLPAPEDHVSNFLQTAIRDLVRRDHQLTHNARDGATPQSLLRSNNGDHPSEGRQAQPVVSTQTPAANRIVLWKRALDLVCIIVTLPAWLPLMFLMMAWVKIASPGPIFYRQERVGHRKKLFMMFKVRTMHVDVETETHEHHFAHLVQTDSPMKKLDVTGDPRLIRGARLFRATGLDELPQLFNILRGEMSLVGPRPCTLRELQRYQPSQHERFLAPPGLTGYWQANGKNRTTFNEMIAMDIFYARRMSLRLDLLILAKTIPSIWSQILEARAAESAKQPDKPMGKSPREFVATLSK